MNSFIIFSIIVAVTVVISDLFETIRKCNENKYKYLKSIEPVSNDFGLELKKMEL